MATPAQPGGMLAQATDARTVVEAAPVVSADPAGATGINPWVPIIALGAILLIANSRGGGGNGSGNTSAAPAPEPAVPAGGGAPTVGADDVNPPVKVAPPTPPNETCTATGCVPTL